MKKIISILLALIMAFSMCTVAFATDGATEGDDITTNQPAEGENDGEADGSEEEAGDFDWLLDLPFWTVKPALKIAKIALKLVKVYVKLGVIFGFVDKNDIIGQIEDLIAGAMGNEEAPEVQEPAPEEGTGAADPVAA